MKSAWRLSFRWSPNQDTGRSSDLPSAQSQAAAAACFAAAAAARPRYLILDSWDPLRHNDAHHQHGPIHSGEGSLACALRFNSEDSYLTWLLSGPSGSPYHPGADCSRIHEMEWIYKDRFGLRGPMADLEIDLLSRKAVLPHRFHYFGPDVNNSYCWLLAQPLRIHQHHR